MDENTILIIVIAALSLVITFSIIVNSIIISKYHDKCMEFINYAIKHPDEDVVRTTEESCDYCNCEPDDFFDFDDDCDGDDGGDDCGGED